MPRPISGGVALCVIYSIDLGARLIWFRGKRTKLGALSHSIRMQQMVKKVSREGGLSALEGDLRKALGRSFLRWEKDKM
jgi:hypothetical protein